MIKKSILSALFISCGIFVASGLTGCQQPKVLSAKSIPNYPIEQGVSAPFAGFAGDRMIVGGGCNFPDVPAADGGKKVFYSTIFACKDAGDSLKWMEEGKFPFPIAYGASVETQDGLICIGGMNEQSPLKEVFSIQADRSSDGFSVKELPSLPESIDNAAAAKLGNTLYVTGGNQGNNGQSLYMLTLGKDSVWNKLADYPGPKRIQPVLLASDEALFLVGGFEVDPETKHAVISSDYIMYDIHKNEWSQPSPVPAMSDGSKRALVGCAGTRADNKLIIAGGVNYEIFKAAVEGNAPADYMKRPSAWYRFSKDVLVYDLLTGEWTVVPDIKGFDKAGGVLLTHNDSLYMVCGEIKPGIRTGEIVGMPLKDLYVHQK